MCDFVIKITTLPDEYPDAHSVVNKLRVEYVVAVEGVVRSRPSESVNPKMKTGAVEVGILPSSHCSIIWNKCRIYAGIEVEK